MGNTNTVFKYLKDCQTQMGMVLFCIHLKVRCESNEYKLNKESIQFRLRKNCSNKEISSLLRVSYS